MLGYLLAAAAVVLSVLLALAAARNREIRLILDNKLHSVRCLSVRCLSARPEPEAEEIVVSGFGILAGRRLYKFNQDGVRLISVKIGTKRMRLCFGKAEKQSSVTLLHGFAGEAEARAFGDALTYETGVVPELGEVDEA